MLIKCPVCGGHVLDGTAVEMPVDDGSAKYCSVRCAVADEVEPASKAPPKLRVQPPKRIVVAVDGSGPALRAVEQAAALASVSGGDVLILHALESGWLDKLAAGAGASARTQLGLDSDEVLRVLESEAHIQLDRCRAICDAGGVECATHVEFKTPVEAIVEASKQADLVVLGSRGLDAVAGTILGSLSMSVIGQTACPVMVVH